MRYNKLFVALGPWERACFGARRFLGQDLNRESGFKGSIPGRGREFFSSPPRPDRLWDPPSLLANGYRRIGGVELYLHFPDTSSWRGTYLSTGTTLPLPLPFTFPCNALRRVLLCDSHSYWDSSHRNQRSVQLYVNDHVGCWTVVIRKTSGYPVRLLFERQLL
jgi:hypothetical protein